MRKNIRKIIALLMTITMILAVCPVEIFAAGEDAAVSSVVTEQTEGDSAVTEASDSEPVIESGKSDSDEAEEPVSNNQSEEVSEQSGAEFVLEKNDTVLPAPTLQRFNRSNVAKRYVITAVFEGEGTEQSPYLIQSADDWDTLANHINSGGTDYNGKYFKLTDDITVTTVLGIRPGSSDSEDRPFIGTFDGAGHTLTVNYNKSGFVAPFAIAHNSTIENLKVKGTVKSTDNHASGLVGASKDVRLGDASYLNIKNVTISTDISCNSHVAGVIGHAHSATITMENVVFKGSISASSVQGGFIGWGGANQGRLFNCTLKDCMFAGTYKSGVAFNPVAYASGQGNVVLTNDFYTTKAPSGGSPITPTGSGTVKLVAATVEKDGQVNYFDNINTAANSSNWTVGSTLKLLTDVTTSSTITVPSGEHTLDLNGYGILITGNSRVITINKDASLKLNDSNPDRIHYITLTDYRGTAVSDSGESSVSNGNGIIQVKGGYLTGGYLNNTGSHDKCGAGVFNWGTFLMNGGNIVGNTMLNNSGAGIRNSGFFTMNSGKIAFNKATANGGGVTTYVPGGSQGKMTMNAGEISDNYCGKYGGGIQLAGPFELTGGAIVRNTADMGGSGIYYSGKGDRFKISGEPIIKDNLNDNLFLDTDATFMISGSLAEDAEIGILMKNNAVFTVGWKDNMGAADPSECFTSDNSNYAVILNSSGEAEIGVPPAARIISGEVTTNYGSISDAVGAWTAGSTLKLLSDVTTGSTITVPSGEHTLDLNGHTLKAGSAGYSVITVGSGAELVIDDTAGGGKITGGSVGQNYGGGITVDACTLTLRGGAVSSNANTYGAIGYCAGGVLVKNSAKFYMEGGEISANTSYVGGGVCCDTSNTTVIITGGEIKNNKITRFGSGVLAGRSSGATFRIGGDAKIVDNISTWTSDKDGEASVNFSKLSISGNPTVHGYWKTSGNSSANTHINLDNEGSSVQRIALDGALTNETGTPQILLSPIYRWTDLKNGKTFVFTSNWSTYMGTANPADYFGVDASVSGVRIIRKDGEAAFTGSGDLGDLCITYNANGGTGEMDAQLVSTTSAVLNQNLFTNGEKEFIGWNTKADGSGTPYSDKGNITLTGDVTLYAQWAEKHEHDDISFTKWDSTTSLPTKAGDYYLGADVTISSTWNVPSGTVNLCLNGHGIRMTGSGTVINVVNGADFTLCDCGENEHRFSVSSPASNGAGLAVVDDTLTSGYKTFTGGYITGGNAREGGGIKVNGTANLVMNGGTVIGNQSSFMGAGIKADNNGDNTSINITVNGGAVIYNTVNGYGAGLCSDGSITMTGGTIAYNYATKDPGGIHCHYLYLSGGSIVNNYADDNEYSAGMHADHEVFISGNPVISDNVYKGTPYNLDWDRTELAHGHKLNITGALSEGAQISVTLKVGGTGVFTNGWSEYMGDADPTKYFTSDNPNYSVFLNQDGEVEIGVPPVASVISGETVTDYGTLADAIGAWTAGSTLKLLADVTTRTMITVPSGEHTLALNGHTITRTDVSGYDNFGLVITLGDGANLTVIGPGKVTGGKGYHGGGIHVEGNSSLVLDNCEISGNAGQFGGGLYLRNGTITMKNGTVVKDNIALAGYGGSGIYAEGSGTLIMDGCTFTNNEIQNENQYAVFLCGNANMKVSGAPVINNNTYGSAQHDLYLYQAADQHSYVLMKDSLTDGAKIIVGQTIGAGVITNGWKDIMGDTDPAKYFTSDNADFVVILKDGEAALEYPPVPDVSASDYTGDYDGAAHGITVSVPTGAAVQYGTEEGDYSLTENPSFTDAGIYNVYYKVTMDKHTPVEGSAVVTINKINATVTITAHNITADYDGKAHSADGFDFAADTTLYTASDFTFSGRAEAVRTDAGKTEMGLSAEQFSNTNENFASVTFNVTDGFVKIDPIDVTVTIMGNNTTVEYDGKAHSAEGYDFEADSSLYNEDDFTFSGNAGAQRTDAGKTDMGLSAEQFSNTNANFSTVTFNVTDGFVKIDPIDVTVTITGHSVTADYDGKAHSAEGYNFEADSELYTKADFTFGGNSEAQRTDAGKTEMGLSAEQFSNTNENFASVTFNVTDGFVKIDPIDVTVTITGNNTTVEYDGKAHSVDGYDFAADNELYTEADFTFDGRAEALGTNAGTYKMGLSAEQFENTNQNFDTVVFDVTDGYLTVNPIDVTVTITGNNTTADYDGKAHSAEGYEFAADSELYTQADFTFSGNAAAERTDAGTVEMGLAPAQFENTNKNFAAVTFNVTDGFVKINQINAVVTITAHTATNPYDGKAHTVSGYDAESSTALYDADKDFEFSGSANATQTNAGTAKMGLAPEQFKNTNKNFATVTFKITDGYQTITRVDAQITKEPRAKDELVYTGDTQALIVSGIAVGGKLYYATGTDDKSVPANAKFKQTLPAAKDIGNYYIWYKVAADDNHKSLAPKCFKVTLAAKDWVSIKGKILDNDKTPLSGAEVILMRGNDVVDTITSYENGEYYFTVPKGVYNLVVKVNGITVTNIADVTGDVNTDIIMSAPNTDSVLDIVSSDKSIAVGGLEKEANLIRKNESVPDEVNVSVKMTVQAIAESETDSSKAITDFAKDKYIEFYDLKVEKTVGTVTTSMDKTQTVLEIAIPCSFTSKREIEVFSCDGSEVKTLSMSDSGEPGTYRVDAQNGLIFVYTNSINTVALAYQPYFSVKSILTLGTFEGDVSVKLEKESGDKVFELSDVSMQDISFKGVPRGTYTLTVKWVDGVENTIELPFNIK